MPTNPKQIPELTAITAPTAGQETDIETVVAKQSTYATYKMTLAQIFTLATVSGAIKTALDNLSTLISGNTTSINNLSTNKLDKSGALRTGLTAKRVLIVDSSGNETYLSGTSPQQIGFDGSGNPATITPSVDIHSLTQKATPIGADEAIIWDSVSLTNQKALLKDLVIIADQTAQSSFSSDNDLFLVKQASGGLRKMTVADTRRALINSGFQTSISTTLVATSSASVSAGVWTYSSSLATGSNGGGLISAVFRVVEPSSNYPDFNIQTSPDNSTWTDIWTGGFGGGEGGAQTNVQVASCVFKAAYVRIGVSLRFAAWSAYKMYGEATVNLTN